MRRRDFVGLLGGAAAWPLTAGAQQPAAPVIGILSATTGADNGIADFKQGLKESGFVEGQNVAIEYRQAENQYDRLPALAADLVRRKVAVIAALAGPAALAAKAATATIPIVFAVGGDPVQLELVPRLNRPGGNITGATFFSYETLPKRVGLLHELIPNARNLGLLINPNNPRAQADTESVRAAATGLGLELNVVTASSEGDLETAFGTLAERHTDMVVIGGDPILAQLSFLRKLAVLQLRYAIPMMGLGAGDREVADAGILITYGPGTKDADRQSGVYAGRILKGEKPADMPVEQPTKYELILNLKTAKALSLTIPPGVLAIADDVIE
jgi:putative tryptophan/tyrosine transport system substrate-binding protein